MLSGGRMSLGSTGSTGSWTDVEALSSEADVQQSGCVASQHGWFAKALSTAKNAGLGLYSLSKMWGLAPGCHVQMYLSVKPQKLMSVTPAARPSENTSL